MRAPSPSGHQTKAHSFVAGPPHDIAESFVNLNPEITSKQIEVFA
jgi:hypothetical protein